MKAADKPLHKDLSFWIVAVTLAGAAIVAQLYYGIPWFAQRLAQAQPAPRLLTLQPAATRPDLDYRKKTYAWQRPQFTPRLLETTPPQVVLMASEYTAPSGGWGQMQADKAIGVRMTAEYVLQSACNWSDRNRVIWTAPAPKGEFDFIANLPSGALDALLAEIKKQWGLVAERESSMTNVAVLTVDHADAPGLKPAAPVPGWQASKPGELRLQRVSMEFLGSQFENLLGLPVVDKTGLTGTYDIQVQPPQDPPAQPGERQEWLRNLFRDQLGLNLTFTNAAVDMLVVKKANQ